MLNAILSKTLALAAISCSFYSWLWLSPYTAEAGVAKTFYGDLRLKQSTAAYDGGFGVFLIVCSSKLLGEDFVL